MLLLAAPLFFFPHYTVTHEHRPLSVVSDAVGNAYVVSYEFSPDSRDYLSKVDADGRLVYRVALSYGYPVGIFVTPDNQGNLYAAVAGSQNGDPLGFDQYFAVKLDPTGEIVYKLPLPTNGVGAPAVGPDGSTYFTGGADLFQTTPGAWVPARSPGGIYRPNAYVIKVSPAGDRVVYATFLDNAPGYQASAASTIAVDALGFAYVGGTTNDPKFPVTAGALQTQCSCTSPAFFVLKLNPDGGSLVYATYLGPTEGYDEMLIVYLDANASVQLLTASRTRIRMRILSPDGSSLLSDHSITLTSTLAGVGSISAFPDGQGNVLLTGPADAIDFPTTDGALREGKTSAGVVRFSDAAILYSTRLPYPTAVQGVAPDGSGGLLILGSAGVLKPALSLARFVPDIQTRTAIFGVANAAENNASSQIAPGEIVDIYGVNLGPTDPQNAGFDASGHLPYSLSGTQVFFNGIQAPLLSVGNQQVIAEVPFGVTVSDTVAIDVRANSQTSNTVELPEGAAEPQIVLLPQDNSGFRSAAALNEDGTVNAVDHPAAGGEILSVFVNGAGTLNPAPEDGTPGRVGQNVALPVSVEAGGVLEPADVVYAGAAPGMAGVTQINLRLPPRQSLRQGPTPLSIYIGKEQTEAFFWMAR
jgi:uncharacterized protein (TIGR03437 family)